MIKSEYPILFKGNMVRAILDGNKTQTRRIIRNQEWINGGVKVYLPNDVFGDFPFRHIVAVKGVHTAYANSYGAVSVSASQGHLLGLKPGEFEWISPYGKKGGLIWVKECHRYTDSNYIIGVRVLYEADQLIKWVKASPHVAIYRPDKKRPSIFMPRWASRIQLRILDIQLQRLNDISEEDAKAEGIQLTPCSHPECVAVRQMTGKDPCACSSYRAAFALGWDGINAKRGYPWASNPWVWCISFKRITMEETV